MTEPTSNNDPIQEARITTIKATNAPTLGMTEDGFFSRLLSHIKERELIDLDGDWMKDVELIAPEPGEKRLGVLTLFESQMFAIAMLAQEIIQDTMIEAQAQTAEAAAKMLRQQKSHKQENEREQQAMLSEEDRIYLNELSVVFHLARAAYEFSARTRLDVYDSLMIVRGDYVAYRVNE